MNNEIETKMQIASILEDNFEDYPQELIQDFYDLLQQNNQRIVREIEESPEVDRWTEHNADFSEVVAEHATIPLEEVKRIIKGEKGE